MEAKWLVNLDLHALAIPAHQLLRGQLGEPHRGHQQPGLAGGAGRLFALLGARAPSGRRLGPPPLGRLAHQYKERPQRVAAHPIAHSRRRCGRRGPLEQGLTADPARGQAHVIAPPDPSDPAPPQALDFAVEGHLETGVGDDHRRRMRRQQRGEALEKPLLYPAIVEPRLGVDLLVEGEAAPPDR